MAMEPAATAAAVIDIWNGAPLDRLHGLLAPDYSRFDAQGRLAEEWAIWSAWMDESSPGPNP